MTGDYTNLGEPICPICVAPDSDCRLCDEPGCHRHAAIYGRDDGWCIEHRGACLSCSWPVALDKSFCDTCSALNCMHAVGAS